MQINWAGITEEPPRKLSLVNSTSQIEIYLRNKLLLAEKLEINVAR